MALTFPRDPYMDFYLGSAGWTSAITSVRQTAPITVTRGMKDEAPKPQPSKLTFTLDNPNGDWSTKNPGSPHYGKFGRNTRVRYGFRTAIDTFPNPVVDGWGVAETGETWQESSSGATADDWQVVGGKATHQIDVSGNFIRSILSSALTGPYYKDVEVRVPVSVNRSDIAGGPIEPANITLREQLGSVYYLLRMTIETNESIKLSLHHSTSGQLSTPITVPGVTLTSTSNVFWVVMQIIGQTVRAKVWKEPDPEPLGWHMTAHAELINVAGRVGVRSGVAVGNTNTKPVIFSYGSVEVRIPRYDGEIVKLTPEWDETTEIKTMVVEAAGHLRRIANTPTPQDSAMRRSLTSLSTDLFGISKVPEAYWPCEDGKNAVTMASAVGGPSMVPLGMGGTVKFADDDDFDCSAPLPQFNRSQWTASIPSFDTSTQKATVGFLVSIPDGGDTTANNTILCRISSTGGVGRTEVYYGSGSGGTMGLRAFNSSGGLIFDDGLVAWDGGVNGKQAMVTVTFDRVTASPDLEIGFGYGPMPADIYSSSVGGVTRTVTNSTFGALTQILLSGGGFFTTTSAGHLFATSEELFNGDLARPLPAWKGEMAGDRALRLLDQEDVELAYIGALKSEAFFPSRTTTAKMGPQKVARLWDLLNNCTTADQASPPYEDRGHMALVFRALESLYDQSPAATLDFSAGQVGVPFKPVDDDQAVVNDMRVKRDDGSEYQATETVGPNSVDEIGPRSRSVTVNVEKDDQLPDIAHFQLLLGTIPDERFPTVRVDLRAPDMDANLQHELLDLDVGDRLDVTDLGSIDVYEDALQVVRGYTETLRDKYGHEILFNTTPYGPYNAFVLDVDRPDSATSTVGTAIDDNDLSMSVATTQEGAAPLTLWSTDPADYPSDVMVGGERMTISAVSGASSPQTFTISARGVNGAAVPHAVGDEVHVAERAYLAIGGG